MIHTKRVNGRKHLALEFRGSQQNFSNGRFVNKTPDYQYAVLLHFVLVYNVLMERNIDVFDSFNINE